MSTVSARRSTTQLHGQNSAAACASCYALGTAPLPDLKCLPPGVGLTKVQSSVEVAVS